MDESAATRRGAAEIERLIESYSESRIAFPQLVTGMETQINGMINHADPAWIDELRSIWLRLELIYASMLDQARDALRAEETRTIEETLSEIRLMLVAY